MNAGLSFFAGEPEYKAKADLVYEKLRRGILEGAFKPGDKLATDQLASALRVSRMPVREAIKRLQLEGFVNVVPHKEVTVASVTEEHIREVFAVRSVLEGLAASQAARRVRPDDIARLHALWEEMKELVATGDTAGQLAKNKQFHEAVYEIAGNKLLQSTASSLFDSIERYRFRFVSALARPRDILEEHRQLIEAIASQDAERAERLARQHIESTGETLRGHVAHLQIGDSEPMEGRSGEAESRR
jgi:DNA-binding GntR family transcriptional regulator